MSLTRRSLLVRGSLYCAALKVEGTAGALVPATRRKLKIVVAGGHPGDPEYACGGTIANLTDQGHEVVLVYLNDGAWPPTPAPVRLAEARRACEILKARPVWAAQQNGAAIIDGPHYESFARLIEGEAPDAVFTHWMIDNHRDHRATAMLCYDAWLKSGKNYALYYFEVSDGEDTQQFTPNRWVDITRSEPRKRAACYAHASQTPERYYALQDEVARFRGVEDHCSRAEAFVLQQQSPHDIFALEGNVSPGLRP